MSVPKPAVQERPVLFAGRLVRSLLRDVDPKTQTRRLATALRVRPRRVITADEVIPGIKLGDATVSPSKVYPAGIGRAGAVFAEIGGRERLGLRPGEFDFICPYASGRTYLDEGRWHIDVAAGQRLWVRETHAQFSVGDRSGTAPQCVAYRATCDEAGFNYVNNGDEIMRLTVTKWTPAIHMPRWASRINLAVAHVRLEHLHDITEQDAIAEGLVAQVGDGGGPGAGYKWTGIGYEGAKPGFFHVPGPDGRCACRVAGPGPARCAFAELWDTINTKRAPWASNPWVWAVTFARVTEVNHA